VVLDQAASEFVEANVGLLHKFMQRYNLDDDYYGLLAICYIYFKKDELWDVLVRVFNKKIK